MIAALAVYSGAVGLLGFGAATPLTLLLPGWMKMAAEVIFIAGGLGMLMGVTTVRGNLEAAGLVLVGSAVLVRTVALVGLVGFEVDIINAVASTVLVVAACVARLRLVLRGETVMRSGGPE